MGKGKRRTIGTIITMTTITIVLIIMYYHISNRTSPSEENVNEVEVLLSKDLELYYPATPKEVVKLYSNMLEFLYSDLEDEEVKALAIKIRELYDDELLENNPMEEYMNNLSSEIAEWKAAERKITNYVFVKETDNLTSTVEGKEYTTIHVSYTFEEKKKYLEVWRFLLRKDDNNHWKILGWNYVPQTEE